MHCVNEGRQEAPALLTRVSLAGSDDESRWEHLSLKPQRPYADMSLQEVDGSRSPSWPCTILHSNGVRGLRRDGGEPWCRDTTHMRSAAIKGEDAITLTCQQSSWARNHFTEAHAEKHLRVFLLVGAPMTPTPTIDSFVWCAILG